MNLIPTTDSSIHYEFQSNQDIATILITIKVENTKTDGIYTINGCYNLYAML